MVLAGGIKIYEKINKWEGINKNKYRVLPS